MIEINHYQVFVESQLGHVSSKLHNNWLSLYIQLWEGLGDEDMLIHGYVKYTFLVARQIYSM